MTTLSKKLFKDIKHYKWQFMAICGLVMLGTAVFGASYDSYRNLESSYAQAKSDYDFSHMWLRGNFQTKQVLDQVESLSIVKQVAARNVIEGAAKSPDGMKIMARLITIPQIEQPKINRLHMVAGDYPQKSGQILVDQHYALHHDLALDTPMQLLTKTGWQAFEVTGIVTSPEFIWPARSNQGIVSSPENFGVFYLVEADLLDFLETDQYSNEMLVLLTDDQIDHQIAMDIITDALSDSGYRWGYLAKNQESNYIMMTDLEAFSELSI
ncbi:MAG TPA: hypothetical protein ENN77_02665, partial [Candidatus Wirthbacteria bacterium]|nr:hypothetical protein [Candidatus Wirthbacteria bacterium]